MNEIFARINQFVAANPHQALVILGAMILWVGLACVLPFMVLIILTGLVLVIVPLVVKNWEAIKEWMNL